jgi:hypothetical protein
LVEVGTGFEIEERAEGRKVYRSDLEGTVGPEEWVTLYIQDWDWFNIRPMISLE